MTASVVVGNLKIFSVSKCFPRNSLLIVFTMENSINEAGAHEPLRSPPRRRRSTFFERRDSIIIVPQTVVENVESCKPELEGNKRHNEDMTSYYKQLLAEKESWKKEVNERRNKYHDLRQQYQLAVEAPGRSRMSYAALSNEDIEYLKAKPNISKLVESQQKLHKSVTETRALYRRANELDHIILSHSEETVKKITDYILDNSTIEPV